MFTFVSFLPGKNHDTNTKQIRFTKMIDCCISEESILFCSDSGVRRCQLLHVGGAVPGAILRHLSAAPVAPLADPLARTEDAGRHLAVSPRYHEPHRSIPQDHSNTGQRVSAIVGHQITTNSLAYCVNSF